MKIGYIVKDKNTKQLGIIIGPYKGPRYDWEVFALKKAFRHDHVWQDCFTEEQLEPYTWRDYPKTFVDKIKLLFWRKK